jgi:hypothetical protein
LLSAVNGSDDELARRAAVRGVGPGAKRSRLITSRHVTPPIHPRVIPTIIMIVNNSCKSYSKQLIHSSNAHTVNDDEDAVALKQFFSSSAPRFKQPCKALLQ